MYRYMTPKGTFLGGLGTLIDIRSESMSRIVVAYNAFSLFICKLKLPK